MHDSLKKLEKINVRIKDTDEMIEVEHDLTKRHIELILQGGVINWIKYKKV